ncbi:MAG: nuclear transport factor 2 family protein [Solirubrobacterales bacterium]
MPGEDPVGGNAGLVRRLFEAFAARDADTLLEIVDPQIEFFGPTATVLNEGRCYRGHEGMRRYLRDVEMLWLELDLEPQQVREAGNHVVALGRVHARAHDGLEIDTPAAWMWRVEGGRITWGCVYGDPDEMPGSLQEGGRAPATFEAARLRATDAATPAEEPLR